jgi:hypothetical protein
MKTKFILFILFCISIFPLHAKNDADHLKYDIEAAGNGTEGTYLVKVWVYASKADKVNSEALKKCAVHGIVFRGFAGKDGVPSQKPMAQSPALEQEKADFFQAFFENDKTFLRYAGLIEGSTESVKVGKKEYKVGAILSVSKDMLRKDLEEAGIVRGLSSGF